MQKSQAYKALAIHQFNNPLASSDVTAWLLDHDPVTLCKALGLYEVKQVKKQEIPFYIEHVHWLLNSDMYVAAIKYLREYFDLDLKTAKYVLDYYSGRTTSWDNLNYTEQSFYGNNMAAYPYTKKD